MILGNNSRTPDGKLKIATILSALTIITVVFFSLVSLSSSSDPSSVSSSWATFLPFTSNGQSKQKEISVPSADGLLGDFIPEVEVRASQGALKSLGQKRFIKENLRGDKKYLTSWPVAGWNNQVICFMHLIYFAVRSGRIPIIPDFTPHVGHLNADKAPLLRFGQVFDVPRLSALLKVPIVEMTELKGNIEEERSDADRWKYDDEFPEYESRIGEWVEDVAPEWEDVGCWSWTKASRHQEPTPGVNYQLRVQNTPLPQAAIGNDYDHGIAIKPFIQLLKQDRPWTALDEWQTELIANSSRLVTPEIMPAHDLACVDETYFLDRIEMATEAGDEPLVAGVGPWNEVGRYMYFAPKLRALTHGYLRRAFGLGEDEKVPSYVAVHIRRGDFGGPFVVFSPLDYSFYVAKVLDQTKKFMGFVPERVVVMTDETDEAWLAQFKDLGWYHIDHVKEETATKLGPWYSTLIDAVALSEGIGFVGLRQSTMADFAYQRVRTWHGGVGWLMYPGVENKAPEGYLYPYGPNAV